MVVYIPYGTSGSKSSYTVRQFLQYYLDREKGVSQTVNSSNNQIPKSDSLVG